MLTDYVLGYMDIIGCCSFWMSPQTSSDVTNQLAHHALKSGLATVPFTISDRVGRAMAQDSNCNISPCWPIFGWKFQERHREKGSQKHVGSTADPAFCCLGRNDYNSKVSGFAGGRRSFLLKGSKFGVQNMPRQIQTGCENSWHRVWKRATYASQNPLRLSPAPQPGSTNT